MSVKDGRKWYPSLLVYSRKKREIYIKYAIDKNIKTLHKNKQQKPATLVSEIIERAQKATLKTTIKCNSSVQLCKTTSVSNSIEQYYKTIYKKVKKTLDATKCKCYYVI